MTAAGPSDFTIKTKGAKICPDIKPSRTNNLPLSAYCAWTGPTFARLSISWHKRRVGRSGKVRQKTTIEKFTRWTRIGGTVSVHGTAVGDPWIDEGRFGAGYR